MRLNRKAKPQPINTATDTRILEPRTGKAAKRSSNILEPQ
jgi:hypothetical protein